MIHSIENTRHSNHSVFCPQNYGSPFNDTIAHISGLGLRRLDFERYAVAGEVIYVIEGDAAPLSQQDGEARIGTLAYAFNKFGNATDATDAAEFTRCLNAICKDGDALCRQTIARHYYNEIAVRGAAQVLKEMALLAMQLASLNSPAEVVETELNPAEDYRFESWQDESQPESIQKFFAEEVEAVTRMIRCRRKSACFAYDDYTEWLNDLEASGVSIEELDVAFAHVDAMEQYDEGGAVIVMSSHERTVACGRVDPEISAEDLPERARHLAGELRRAYISGVEIGTIWEEINPQIEVLFPVSGKTADGGRFFSHANRELQHFTRQCLEALFDECRQDFHLTAMRTSLLYRQYYGEIREAFDTKTIGEAMKQAYGARQLGALSVKHLVALKTAANLQRERLERAPISKAAHTLIEEVRTASLAKLKYLSWAFYGNNQPANTIHTLARQESSKVWQVLNDRKQKVFASKRAA